MNDSSAPPRTPKPSKPPMMPELAVEEVARNGPPAPAPSGPALPALPPYAGPPPGAEPPPQHHQPFGPPAVETRPRLPLRTMLVSASAALAVVCVIIFLVFRPTPPRKARSIGARLDLAAGDVTVNDATGDIKALSGTPLGSGATVTTAKGARALVRTGEGAALFLRGETSLKLLERGVDVASGEVFLEAPRVDGDALECTVGAYRVSASDAGVSIKRDGKDLVVYVARGLAILTSPGGRVEIGAGEQGVAKADAKPLVTSVAFWQDWTGGMGDQRGARS